MLSWLAPLKCPSNDAETDNMGRFPHLRRCFPLALAIALLLPATARAADPLTPWEGDPGVSTEDATTAIFAPVVSAFSDVGSGYTWARQAINHVAGDHQWMRDYGNKFRPGLVESRAFLARAMVRAFGTGETVDPSIVFNDLPADDPFYEFANIAVQNGWMRTDGNRFRPDAPVTIYILYRALVSALPLDAEVDGLDDIHSPDGIRFDHPSYFPTTELGMRLGFRYNHPQEGKDVEPDAPLPRAEVAYALWKAKTLPQYKLDDMRPFRTIELPNVGGPMKKVIEWDLRYVGYPYIWGGEWFKKNGSQPTGGWDCSGFLWWSLKRPISWYDPTKAGRPYNGWSLPQRTSATMAGSGGRIGYSNLKPGDLMFYDGSGDAVVDHVNMYAGNGWAFDTGSSVGGTSLLQVDQGTWYRDHFKWGRRIM